MQNIEQFIISSYPTAHPFEGINRVNVILSKKKYVVIIDENNEYHGIITPEDLLTHPHKIVKDCICQKVPLQVTDSVQTLFKKIKSNDYCVYPVFEDSLFVGVIEKEQIFNFYQKNVHTLYKKARQSQKIKESFLNNLSHEIRTPLNGIVGFMQLLQELDIDDNRMLQKTYVDIVQKSAKRLLMTMEDLIEYSKICAGEVIIIRKTNFTLQMLIDEIVECLELSDWLPHSLVTYQYPQNEILLFTDLQKIKKVLWYLIEYAIKTCKNANTLEILCTKKSIIFSIHIPQKITAKELHQLFKFQDNSIVTEDFISQYIGIGLPLIKKYVEFLGGQIEINSYNTHATIACSFFKHQIVAKAQ